MADNAKPKNNVRSLILGGLLPIVAYTFVEEYFGIFWGLVAGMVLAVGEIVWEKKTQNKVDPITWAGSGFILVLGSVSLFTQEGIWFRLQPAILEGVFAIALWTSVALGKPFLTMMARKQNLLDRFPKAIAPFVMQRFSGMTLRIGAFFAVHSALATWAALHWSTRSWALLKGVGVTVSMVIYMVIETLVMRSAIQKRVETLSRSAPYLKHSLDPSSKK